MMARMKSVSILAGLTLALAISASAETVMHGRVSYESGGGMVKGAADSDWGYATVNSLVLSGDTLWADTGALLEVEFNGGTFLRMADKSKVDVAALPPAALFQAWSGAFYVHRVARSSGDVLFKAPACTVSVDRDSQVRIDVLDTGATTVTVRWGHATVAANTGQAVSVMTAQRVYVDPGFLPSLPQRYDTSAEDDFDAWSRERARLVAMGDKALPPAYRVTSAPLGTSDLTNYGEWIYVDSTPYWRPTVIVNYVPYRQGIWSYTPGCGYVWVGDYPFSYVTSHYGRWTYNNSYGWMWCYSDAWSPAWVASVRCGDYFAWAPLGLYDQPVTVGTAVFNCGSFVLTVGASSYCLADNLFYGYSYGSQVTQSTFGHISADNVYVWNINADTININIPWAGNLPVNSYKPQRVMRGPDTMAAGSRMMRAGDRASQLESSIGRRSFEPAERADARGMRTALNGSGREARLRDVGVEPARAMEGGRMSERVASAASMPEARAPRQTRTMNTDNPAVEGQAPAIDLRRGGNSSLRTVRETGAAGSGSANGVQGIARSTREVGGANERTIAPQDGQRTQRNISSGSESSLRTAAPITGRAGRTVARDNTAISASPQMQSSAAATTRTAPRTAPRAISLGNSSRSQASSTERSPQVDTPMTMQNPRVETPRQTGIRTTERTSVSAPRTIDRSMTSVPHSIERSVPSRSTQISNESTTRRIEAPAQRIAPRIETPRVETPRIEAPQRNSNIGAILQRGSSDGGSSSSSGNSHSSSGRSSGNRAR